MDLDHKALIETFRAEAEENLATIEEALVALEAHPEDADLLHEIFRAAHTLKGNAAALELPGVAALAHNVEDLLDRLRAGTLEATATLVTLLRHRNPRHPPPPERGRPQGDASGCPGRRPRAPASPRVPAEAPGAARPEALAAEDEGRAGPGAFVGLGESGLDG